MFENWKKYLPGNGFWTGHSDLYKDSQRVEFVQNELTTIKGLVPPAQSEAQSALTAVNEALANTGYRIDPSAIDQVYSYIDNMVGQIKTQIENKSTSADEYARQTAEHPFATILATGGMVLSKFGEGVASAFEDVGDAVGTCFGWVEAATDALGITDKGTTFWADIVKEDISHNIFHSINEGLGINKYSLITEDSGLANISKAAGVATGYLTMAGWLGGAAEGYGNIRNGAKFTKFLASSTNANTVIAGIGGFGSGVENGLQSGQTFAGANLTGLIQGTTQAAVAYGMGKLGEHIDRAKKLKSAEADLAVKQEAFNNTTKAWNTAQSEYSAALKSGDAKAISAAWKKLQQASLDDGAAKGALAEAQKTFNTFTNTKVGFGTSTTYQGYTDPVSMKAREQGVHFGETLASNVAASGSSGIRALPKALVKTETQLAKEGFNNAKTTLHNATHDATTGKFSVGQTVKSTAKGAWNAVTTPVKTTASLVSHGLETGGETVKTVARDALGVVAATGVNGHNSKITEQYEAGKMFGKTTSSDTTQVPTDTEVIKDPDTTKTENNNDSGSKTGSENGSENGSKSGSNNGSYYGGGSYSGGGGTSTVPTTTTPTDPITPTVPVSEPPTTPTTTPTTTPPTTEPTQTIVIETPTPSAEQTVDVGGGQWVNDSGGEESTVGGEYSETGGFIGDAEEVEPELADLVDDATDAIDEIIKGNKYTKIPTSSTPLPRPTTSSGNAFIPIAAGLSAAAAAGLGAKAYMDRKNNSDNGEDDIYTDDWSDDETIDVNYDDSTDQEQYLDDDYNYENVETEKYGARNSEELADLQ